MSTSSAPSLTQLLFWLAIPLAGLALVLLKIGWLPRRRGDEPRCRRCGYELTHNESGTCPECGADVSRPGSIVHGVRTRRPAVTLAGAIALLLAVALVAPPSRRAIATIDTYAWRPTSWVLRDLRRPAPADRIRALAELERRRAAGTLNADQRRDAVETILADQAVNPAGVPLEFLNWLNSRAVNNELSEEQRTRFFRQMFDLSLTARPRVALGQPLPWRLAQQVYVPPGTSWSYKASFASLTVDGVRVPGGEGSMSTGATRGASSQGSWSALKNVNPGRHTLRAVAVFDLYEGGTNAGGRSLFKGEFPVETAFEVLPAGEEDVVTETAAPALADTLKSLIRPQDLSYGINSLPGVYGNFQIADLPVNAAFDIFIRTTDGREYRNGTLTWAKGRGLASMGFWGERETTTTVDPPPDRVDVILRSSPAVARRTVEMTDIWKGELVYEAVPVKLPAPPATAPTR